ncbi:YxeA family protein [Peribacillus butanolivorans]|uniref:YxeA family protein n=1 Tax=Peribacillus butanolivorans TaxID=421767 RepID=UPI0036718AF4
MKKLMMFFLGLIALIIGFLVFIQNVNINRLGADQYYVQIKEEGMRVEGKADNGEEYISYEYKLSTVDKDGKEKELTFTAHKQLRLDAYLCLYVKDEKGVTSWQEVKMEELPEKVKEKLD